MLLSFEKKKQIKRLRDKVLFGGGGISLLNSSAVVTFHCFIVSAEVRVGELIVIFGKKKLHWVHFASFEKCYRLGTGNLKLTKFIMLFKSLPTLQ